MAGLKLLKFNQTGKTRAWATSNEAQADVMYFCSDGTIVLNKQVCGSYSVEATSGRTNKVGKVKVNGTDITVYEHPTTTAQAAAAKKVGYDDMGHVVLGDSLVKGDVGLGNVDNKSATTLKSEFTGSIADGNTGFVTGDAVYDALGFKLDANKRGAANGVASLDANGKVPASELPSYVDDVVDFVGCYEYTNNGVSKLYRPLIGNKLKPASNVIIADFTNETEISSPSAGTIYIALDYNTPSITGVYSWNSADGWSEAQDGESDKIYVETSTNRTYRFSDGKLKDAIEIKASPGTLDDIAAGSTNKHFTSTEKTKLSGISTGANKTEASQTNGNIKIDGSETTVYTHPNAPASAGTGGTAPAAKKVGMDAKGHVVLGDNLAKSDVGLGNVTNNKQIKALADSAITEDHFVLFGTNGDSVKDAGFGEDVLEKNTNKVTTVRAASNASDTSYPSEKAVRSAIDGKKVSYDDLEYNLQGKIDDYDGHIDDAPEMSAKPLGLYKIAITEHGHISDASGSAPTAVVKSDLIGLGVEDASNKVTSLSSSSTDTQYPSAKCVYDLIKALQDRVAALEDALTLEKVSE